MILNRLGNKSNLSKKIQTYFPPHKIYIEPFFGAGGMYFNKPKAKFNYLNDIDEDVYNVFRQVIDNKDELINTLEKTPIIEKQFKEWSKGKKEKTDVMNAVRYLILSNYGLYGKPNTLRIGAANPKCNIINTIDATFEYLKDTYIFNTDFRNILNKIEFRNDIDKTFIYCDPPYINTDNNYSKSFTKEDSADLFQMLVDSKIRFAISEFNQPFILEQAKKYNLKVITIGERINLNNKRIEILICNYIIQPSLFDEI